MVSWDIKNSEIWKNKDKHEKEFDLLMTNDEMGISFFFGFGVWACMDRARKNPKSIKTIVVDEKLVNAFFDDKERGAYDMIKNLDEKKLKKAMMLLVGTEFF